MDQTKEFKSLKEFRSCLSANEISQAQIEVPQKYILTELDLIDKFNVPIDIMEFTNFLKTIQSDYPLPGYKIEVCGDVNYDNTTFMLSVYKMQKRLETDAETVDRLWKQYKQNLKQEKVVEREINMLKELQAKYPGVK